jgi:hypothetical protein
MLFILMNNKILKYTAGVLAFSAGLGLTFKLEDPHLKMGIIGLLAQVSTDYLFHPLDLVNVRTKFYYRESQSTYTTTSRILNSTGISGFFRGGSVTLMASSIGGFIYYALYKNIREQIKEKIHDPKKNYIAYSIASVTSQLVVYIFYYPFELIKTRIQTGQFAYKHFFDGVNKIYAESDKGKFLKNLYLGYIPSMFLSTSTAFLVFFTFEIARDYIAKLRGIKNTDVSGLDYFACTVLAGVVSATTLNFLEVYTIQRQIHGSQVTFREFIRAQNIRTILTSGILARNLYGMFYTIFLLEFVNIYGKIYGVKL